MAMTPGRIALLLVVAALVGCYRPDIKDAGLVCADGGRVSGGVPLRRGPAVPQGEKTHVPAGRGGGAACAAISRSVSSAIRSASRGASAAAATWTGTSCECVPSGSKVAGDFCNLANDDCAAGLVCLREPCSPENPDAGSQLGRCYRYCAGDQHCDGMSCNVPIVSAAATPLSACQLPPRTCDPVDATHQLRQLAARLLRRQQRTHVLRVPRGRGGRRAMRRVHRAAFQDSGACSKAAGRRRAAGGCAGWAGRTARRGARAW